MRDYVLTELERKIIKEYVETGKRLEGFNVLLHRCRKQNPQQIKEDLQLIEQFIDKIGCKNR